MGKAQRGQLLPTHQNLTTAQISIKVDRGACFAPTKNAIYVYSVLFLMGFLSAALRAADSGMTINIIRIILKY
jgi:hypothetical protein